MTIKDFKVGQTVFVMGDGSAQRDRFRTAAAEVVKIGRKYVTISGNWAMQFKETHESRPYLVEHTEYGAPRLLFPSREAVDDYIEREELKTWVRTATGWEKIDRYTLAQLREVKRILEGGCGRWKEHRYGTTLDPSCVQYYCSICNAAHEDYAPNFCPECGTRMEGIDYE